MTVHVPDHKAIDSASLAQIFTEARTHNGFLNKPVSDELLHKAIDLAKMGPTSARPASVSRGVLPERSNNVSPSVVSSVWID